MGEREEDGDGVGEEEGGGAGRVEEGQGEHEHRADDVERVEVGQTDHQTVEGVDLLSPAAEDDDEEEVAEDPQDGDAQQHHALDVELEQVGEGLVLGFTGRHLQQGRGRDRVRPEKPEWKGEERRGEESHGQKYTSLSLLHHTSYLRPDI